jgi:hypothetical protein
LRVPADPLAPLLDLPGVRAAVDRTRTAVDALLGNQVLRRRSADVSAESVLRGAWASAWLAGREVALDDVRSGSAADDPVVQGALRAQSAIGSLADTWTRAPRQALARLHALAAGGSVDASELGRPRGPEEAARLRSLADLLLAPTAAPALVVAAVAHADLCTVAPFGSHNGIVARAAERLLLVARGVDEKSLVVPEAGHLALRAAYESNLRGYRDGGRAGVHSWLLYAAEAYAAGAEASPVRG